MGATSYNILFSIVESKKMIRGWQEVITTTKY